MPIIQNAYYPNMTVTNKNYSPTKSIRTSIAIKEKKCVQKPKSN